MNNTELQNKPQYNEEEDTWDFGHNPFSMPQGGLEALNGGDLENIVAYHQYLCNKLYF